MALNGKESAVEVQRVLTSREEKEVKEKAKNKKRLPFSTWVNQQKREKILRKPPKKQRNFIPNNKVIHLPDRIQITNNLSRKVEDGY